MPRLSHCILPSRAIRSRQLQMKCDWDSFRLDALVRTNPMMNSFVLTLIDSIIFKNENVVEDGKSIQRVNWCKRERHESTQSVWVRQKSGRMQRDLEKIIYTKPDSLIDGNNSLLTKMTWFLHASASCRSLLSNISEYKNAQLHMHIAFHFLHSYRSIIWCAFSSLIRSHFIIWRFKL